MAKLFVGGISPQFTEIQLAEMLAIHGEILTVKFIYDRKTKKAKGYGFVEMQNRNAALQVIDALNGKLLGKRELQFNLVEEPSCPTNATENTLKSTTSKAKRPRKTAYQPLLKTKTG